MARGWESKSVEEQIDAAEANRASKAHRHISPETAELLRRKESLLLSRTRVIREMEKSQNPRYRALMTRALADLNAQLSKLPS